MILEAITFKLALDFFKFLKKNRITATSIKVDFFDRIKHEYIDFADVAAMEAWYNKSVLKVKQSRYSKWVHWVVKGLKTK